MSFSYAKILGETNFRTREIPRSGSKAKDGEKERVETDALQCQFGWRTQSRLGQLFIALFTLNGWIPKNFRVFTIIPMLDLQNS